MTARTQTGSLVLADISGFTAFLARTELEHAHDILLELLQLVVDHLKPSLTVAEIEGDAVFAYAPRGAFPRGETLLELVETTYGAFLGRVEAIRLHTTCSCTACSAIPILDLKFILHYGEYILQAVTGPGKPLGSAVNLAHRLLKNRVGEATGWKAYALFTDALARELSLDTEGFHRQVEAYQDLPPVETYSFDLRQRWVQIRQNQRFHVSAAQADARFAIDLPAAPPLVWDWLNDPQRRSSWIGLQFERAGGSSGRTGVGTTAHCTHGAKVESVHTLLDWQPFDYFTEQISRPSDGRPEAVNTVELEPIPGGTRLHSRYKVLLKPRWLIVPFFRVSMAKSVQDSLRTLHRLLVQEAQPGPVSLPNDPLVSSERP